MNLIATDGKINQQKGASDGASWLPPNKQFRCTYVTRQIAVEAKYDLWVTRAEKNAMVKVLSACPDMPLPTSANVTNAPVGYPQGRQFVDLVAAGQLGVRYGNSR